MILNEWRQQMLDVWRLKLLVQFDTLKTMHRVAEVMAVTTATVSTQLKLLETQTNSTLFEKVGRNVALTATGKQLVKQVRPILDELEEVERTLNAPRNDDRGIVRIGAFSSSLQTLVVPAVTQVKDQHAGISFVLSEMEPPESLAALSSHQIDLAIIGYIGELMTIPDELTAIEWGLISYRYSCMTVIRLLRRRASRLLIYGSKTGRWNRKAHI
jgi:Transcriptional regulator